MSWSQDSAFPITAYTMISSEQGESEVLEDGLSIRDYAAIKILAALCSRHQYWRIDDETRAIGRSVEIKAKELAVLAVDLVDELAKELTRREKEMEAAKRAKLQQQQEAPPA